MTSVLRELPLSYAVLPEGRRCGSPAAVHEPSPAGPPSRASSIAPAEPSARVAPPRRARESPRAGTEQLLAQRKKRFKTLELLVAERDWRPPPPRFAHDQIVGLRVAFADVAVRDRVKQAGGTWNPARRVWQWMPGVERQEFPCSWRDRAGDAPPGSGDPCRAPHGRVRDPGGQAQRHCGPHGGARRITGRRRRGARVEHREGPGGWVRNPQSYPDRPIDPDRRFRPHQ